MAARILIVEDNAANLELMRYLLSASGYPTLVARDGLEGVRMANAESPDLIICDVQMPGMNGHELAQAIRGSGTLRKTPLIAVTAFARASDQKSALDAGFDGYLSKPIEPQTFVAQVEVFLPPNLRLVSPILAASPAESRAGRSANGRTVLIVDDVQANLDLSSSLLGYAGFSTVTSRNATEALLLARQNPPDLILSDVCMKEGSGYDFIQTVKSDPRLASIPFVFVTSTVTNEKDRQRGLALGAARFLFRPIEPEKLLKAIESCLFGTEAT